jgi:hypothetical protein
MDMMSLRTIEKSYRGDEMQKRQGNLLKILGGGVLVALLCGDAFAENPQAGLCTGGYCAWGIIKSKAKLKEVKGASLYKLEVLAGTSEHKEGQYPEKYDSKIYIEWNKKPHPVYVFCYDKLPVVVVDNKPNVLNFQELSHSSESDAGVYVEICYGIKDSSWASEGFASKHNLEKPSTDDVKIKDPLELFKYVK